MVTTATSKAERQHINPSTKHIHNVQCVQTHVHKHTQIQTKRKHRNTHTHYAETHHPRPTTDIQHPERETGSVWGVPNSVSFVSVFLHVTFLESLLQAVQNWSNQSIHLSLIVRNLIQQCGGSFESHLTVCSLKPSSATLFSVIFLSFTPCTVWSTSMPMDQKHKMIYCIYFMQDLVIFAMACGRILNWSKWVSN